MTRTPKGFAAAALSRIAMGRNPHAIPRHSGCIVPFQEKRLTRPFMQSVKTTLPCCSLGAGIPGASAGHGGRGRGEPQGMVGLKHDEVAKHVMASNGVLGP
jgi:hypothetical protein